jgi:ankyrin repeat protein
MNIYINRKRKKCQLIYQNNNGYTFIWLACYNSYLEVDINSIIVLKSANMHQVNNVGSTHISFACAKGHLDIVKLLILEGENMEISCKFFIFLEN